MPLQHRTIGTWVALEAWASWAQANGDIATPDCGAKREEENMSERASSLEKMKQKLIHDPSMRFSAEQADVFCEFMHVGAMGSYDKEEWRTKLESVFSSETAATIMNRVDTERRLTVLEVKVERLLDEVLPESGCTEE